MTTIVTREVGATAKGSPLTNAEVDNNFISLNTDKIEATNIIAGPGVVRTQVGNDITLQVSSVAEYCKNVSGATIQKGTPVYQVGSIGQQLTVAPADANDPAKMPAIGVVNETLANGAEGTLIILGLIQGVNTSAFSQGDEVYVAPGGGYTNVKPANSSTTLIQFLGIVNRVSAASGSGIIFGTAQALTQTTEETDEVKFARVTIDNVDINGNTINATSGDLTLNAAGNINASSKKIINVATPTATTDAVNKAYVDEVAQGIVAKPAVKAATTVNLPSTYNNGTLGLGATLTSTTNGAFPLIDGVQLTTVNGDRGLLVKDQTNAAHNGRYNLTDAGSASTPWVLTRCGVCATAEQIPSAYVFVQEGTIYANTGWVAIVADLGSFTVGVDSISWQQFSGAGTFTAGTGLTLNGTQFNLANTSVAAGAYGSSTQIPSFTVDAQGRLTAAANNSITVGNGALTFATSGVGLSGSGSFTANQTTNSTITITSNATSANTASTLVARDASGNFTAGTVTAALAGNASTATNLATGRTIGMTGDVTWTSGSFNGSANVTGTSTLANTAVNAGTYGSSTQIPSFTVDSKGRVTGASTFSISVGEGILTVQGNTGLSGSGTFNANASGNTTITLTNADRGSSQNIFKNIANSGGTTQFSAGSNTDAIRFAGSGATSVTFDNATKTVTYASTAPANGTLTLGTSGIATGSQTFTANQATAATFTVNVPGTNIAEGTRTTTAVPITSSTGTGATLSSATTSLAGVMSSADKTKLDGIAAGAQVNVATNLTYSTAATTGTVNSSTGTNATIPAATQSLAGLMTNADKTKLDGIAAGAQVNTVTSVAGKTGAVTLVKADVGLGSVDNTADSAKSVLEATRLTTARTIGGVSFNGSANIDLPGVNTAGNQNTTGTSSGVVRTVAGTTSAELVRGNMGDNDQARILVGATASNAGFLEIATADDGTEPIHVRQYTGVFTTLTRTATLLDGSGNTIFPGTVTAPTFSGALSGNASTATTLQTARTINGTSFNGSANITTSNWGTARTLSFTGDATGSASVNGSTNVATAMTLANSGVTAGTYGGNNSIPSITVDAKGRITAASTVTPSGTYAISISGSSASTTGNAATATALQTARTINGVSFNGTANITLPTVNTSGNQTITGVKTFSGGIALANADITGVNHITINDPGANEGIEWLGGSNWKIYESPNDLTNAGGNLQFVTGSTRRMTLNTSGQLEALGGFSGALSGNATTATTLATARTINGTSFNGSANITTANWGTARTITIGNTGKSVNGSGNVTWTLAEIGADGATLVDAGSASVGAVQYNGTTAAAGRFYGGTTNPSQTTRLNYGGHLHVNDLVAVGNVNSSSDERLKTNWRTLPDNFLESLSKVKHGIYDRVDNGLTQAGVSAQDMQKVLEQVVSEDSEGMLSVNYGNAALVAVIELTKQVLELKEEIRALKSK